jgi:rfaE bifunctional protein nucleotidyltransferase chain/domain
LILAREKILELEDLALTVHQAQASNKVVAMCHGCFDILHMGHVRHFETARAMADILVVTVTQDRFVNKGPSRPVFPEAQRAEVLAGLSIIDWVAVNRWGSAVETIRLIRPNLFIKGQEYESRAEQVNPNFLEEAKVVKEVGGKFAFTRNKFTSSSTRAFKRLEQNEE